jgi:hypothetical protein
MRLVLHRARFVPDREIDAMRGILAAILSLGLGLDAALCRAEDFPWRPASANEAPVVTLGRPVPLGAPLPQNTATAVFSQNAGAAADAQLRTASYMPPAPANGVGDAPGAVLSAPTLLPPAGIPTIPASPAEQYNCGVVTRTAGTEHPFWDRCQQWAGEIPGVGYVRDLSSGRPLFQSDHTFDNFISPITNPFYFEDPRSLTELRPIFMWQGTPRGNPIFHGGDIVYLGLQGRLALTDCLSVVLTKLGEVWMEPHRPVGNFQDHAGFAGIILGPKYTFLRSEPTGTLGAVGLNFDIPAGSQRVLENTGSLTLEPYISMGQSFFHTPYGSFQALGTFGYNFSIDNQRSDNLFLSLHLDFDYGDLHKIYPLLELNWFQYTTNGHSQPINFEGRDLVSFGSRMIAGHGEVSLAAGGRFKLNENLQMGLALEFPLGTQRNLMDYRLMADFIFRY